MTCLSIILSVNSRLCFEKSHPTVGLEPIPYHTKQFRPHWIAVYPTSIKDIHVSEAARPEPVRGLYHNRNHIYVCLEFYGEKRNMY